MSGQLNSMFMSKNGILKMLYELAVACRLSTLSSSVGEHSVSLGLPFARHISQKIHSHSCYCSTRSLLEVLEALGERADLGFHQSAFLCMTIDFLCLVSILSVVPGIPKDTLSPLPLGNKP